MAGLMEDAAAAPSWIQLESIIPLGGSGAVTVKKITNLSPDTVKRVHGDRVVHTAERRVGMKLKHALEIAGTNTT
jgi:hypothetical protein